jgi:hypothetical protein
MKRLHHVFESAAVLLERSRRTSASSIRSDNATPFDTVLPDEVPDSPIDCKSSCSSTSELTSTVNLDGLGRANLRAVSRMQGLYPDEAILDIKIPEDFNEMTFDAAESEVKYLILTNTWPRFVNAGRANSQMSKDCDEEKGNNWTRNFLC